MAGKYTDIVLKQKGRGLFFQRLNSRVELKKYDRIDWLFELYAGFHLLHAVKMKFKDISMTFNVIFQSV